MDLIIKNIITRLIVSSSILLAQYSSANIVKFETLSDSELSDVTGQALMSLSYISPNDSANKMSGKGIGFYKLGMEAEVDINANIAKLQLGCGGVNGANGCDIDIDNLSLSGISDTRDGRASSSAKLTNPFLEFALRNPNSASTREVVGLRLSAEKIFGLMTMGEENKSTPNGINTLSGYMKINATKGSASTAERTMTYSDTQLSIDGAIQPNPICIFICITLPTISYKATSYSLNLKETKAPITLNEAIISGNRMESAKLSGEATIGTINFDGALTASVFRILNLKKNVTGDITGLQANVKVDQNLGFIHKMPLNNPFSLSLQNQNIWWPGADAQSERGWWMAFDDAIDIGDVTPERDIDITNDVLKQVVEPISTFLTANPIECAPLSCVFDSSLAVGNVNLNGTKINFPLKDLELANQKFVPNCFGSLKFC